MSNIISFFTSLFADLETTGTTIGIIVGIICIIGAAGGIPTLIINLYKNHISKKTLKVLIQENLYTADQIKNSKKYYIKPTCQSVDPAGSDEMRGMVAVKGSLFKQMNEFVSTFSEYRYIIILADSGMGKSSFMINYFYEYMLRRNRKADIVLLPLGIPDVDEKIKQINDKNKKILFLDAFDEDTLAVVDHRQRLKDIISLTLDFPKVVITCRTQFFTSDEELPGQTGVVKIGVIDAGETREHIFHKLYLTPFNDKEVKQYLCKRYKPWHFKFRKKAFKIVDKIPNIKIRPMLLSHVDNLLEDKTDYKYTYDIYEAMVNAWLEREVNSLRGIEKAPLMDFSEKLAVNIFLNRKQRGSEKVPRTEIKKLANEWGIDYEEWKLTGRSLLNRDAVGNCKFAHRSIMEFLFIKQYIKDISICKYNELTDQMKEFIKDIIYGASLFENNNFVEMVLVPAGEFKYGSKEDDKDVDNNEKPQRIIELGEFYIDKYPVTNLQYCRFLNYIKPDKTELEKWIYLDGKYEKEKCRIIKKGNDYIIEEGYNNYPVIYVTWDGAKAYADWAGKKLPTEEQWEKAARGKDGLIYPWGNGFKPGLCNSKESGEGKTTPVDTYPEGRSVYGCMDMAGNVWEWTESFYDKDKGWYTVRGGSWYNDRQGCRCAVRGFIFPASGSFRIGFRCVRN